MTPDPGVPPLEAARPAGRHRTAVRVVGLVALGLGLGALGGLVWWGVAEPPSYLVGANGGVSSSERELAAVFGPDAWFCLVGAVVGLALGVLTWRQLRTLGWAAVVVATLTALASALVCWAVGRELGPGEFNPRLALARPGDRVPLELTLQARASLLVWPFFAVVPVLLGSSLGPDEEEPPPATESPPPVAPAAPTSGPA